MICLAPSVEGRTDSLTDIQFKIASRYDELCAAFELVYQAYTESGLTVANRYEMRITPFHLLPTTEVVIARCPAETVCTATLVRDGIQGLPICAVYPSEVELLREQGLVLAEVSCLADRRKNSRREFAVLNQLMSLIAQISKNRGVDQLLIAVHPRHERFYERCLGFERFGCEKSYPSVRNRPAVALALDINNLSHHSPRAYERLFGRPFPKQVLQQRKMSPEVLAELRQMVTACQRGNSETPTKEEQLVDV